MGEHSVEQDLLNCRALVVGGGSKGWVPASQGIGRVLQGLATPFPSLAGEFNVQVAQVEITKCDARQANPSDGADQGAG